MEGLKECEANMVMYLHPCKAKSPTDAILRELSSLLFTSDEVVLHISGSLTADSSEFARRLDKNLDKWSQTDSTSKRRKSMKESKIQREID